MSFTNNLMIFCASDVSSLGFVRETLLKFKKLSSLVVNLGKSSIFMVGVDSESTTLLADMGHLHVRYLGLPLLSSRLRLIDCIPLIQRITS